MIGLMEKNRDEWPAWGRLIDDARDRLDPPVSQNEAARQLDMSGTNWRRIVQGVSGPMATKRGARTVARMARLAGVTPDQLKANDHPLAADELRRLEASAVQRGEIEKRYNFRERFERIRQQLDDEQDERAAEQLDIALRMIERGPS